MNQTVKNEWTQLMKKMPLLFFGFFLYALGILTSVYANLGMSPWGVFHMGISNYTPFTLGQVTQLFGLLILVISYLMGVMPGLGSIFNMIFIGAFIDLIELLGILRTPGTLMGQIIMLLVGVFISGWATYFYLQVHLGAGPRDGLMEGLVRKLQKPVWKIRGVIEFTVLSIGFLLGGPVGLGTLVTATTIGFSVQFAFKIGKYDPRSVQHTNLTELMTKLSGHKLPEETVGHK
ncbi:protein of unknown function DUF161 [Alkaliphilus metalliredigens QYMF]|uniref:Integral membrane protein n=1 Tax=Alkaliphilus metalliredigens (strain QYMF) TaxID=293826 RepID=A6TM82_ALKMQ|nr:membrane protein [Alkaliphilus metalliredigens]ABR47300.1 protein of unknown function DUF161 [Alkaliphilus metalliredigens QYMF]